MSEHDFKLFIPKTQQKQQVKLYTPVSNPQTRKPVALFSRNMVTQYVSDELKANGTSEEEWEKLCDVLDDAFHEADNEDLYGKLLNSHYGTDFILNKNEQKNFLEILKEKSEKLFETVSKYIENLNAKNDEEKIAKNLYLKVEDWGLLRDNKQVINYGLQDLDNENIMAVYSKYDDTCLLYQLYADTKERADEEIPDEELSEDSINERLNYCFEEGEERTEEKIKEYTEEIINSHKKYRQSCIDTKNDGLKDLEIIKEKSIDYANYLIQLARKENVYSKDYKKLIADAIEKDDIKNLTIYTQRFSDRIFMKRDKANKTVNASKRAIELKEANGQIDTTFVQGYTGDCWFLSALKSMCSDKEVLNMINDMITVNKENDVIKSVTVKIQDKEYTIDYEKLKAANEYSTGDLDVRAIEMALNQYVHDNNLAFGDITLGWEEKDAYKFLFGEDNVEVAEYKIDDDNFKFDSEKYLKTLQANSNSKIMSNLSIYPYEVRQIILDQDDKKIFADDKDGNQVELHFQHAYNFTKIDENFLYFTDPHAPEKELHIPKEKVGTIFNGAITVKFKDNNDQASL